jgi:hypothetical protein
VEKEFRTCKLNAVLGRAARLVCFAAFGGRRAIRYSPAFSYFVAFGGASAAIPLACALRALCGAFPKKICEEPKNKAYLFDN